MSTESLTDLQLAVMKVLWDLGEASVGDVLANLEKAGQTLAPTTVATLLQRLSKQGWVEHRKSGRAFLYRAAIDRKAAARGVLNRVMDAFFGGKASALTAELLDSERVTRQDLEEIRRLIAKGGR